tara:strand:- start:16 stop:690 length:675 start_codon:yes stop_codon:yes gene_type:complete
MLLFQPTKSNLAELKEALRTAYPTALSSHLSESIAAALGFRTNAALKVRMKHFPDPRRPIEFYWDQFRKRMLELGDIATDQAPPSEPISTELLERCWREISPDDVEAMNDWFHRCKTRGVPYIYTIRSGNCLELHWDCITTDGDCDCEIREDKHEVVVKLLFSSFQNLSRGQKGNPQFDGSAFVGSIEGISSDCAESIAEHFYNLLSDRIGSPCQTAQGMGASQ